MDKLFTLLFCLLFPLLLEAQQSILEGKILQSESKEPLVGVSIQVKGSTEGTITSSDGTFSLSTQASFPLTLIFSAVGYETKTINVSKSQRNLQISLAENTLGLAEVVVSASRNPETLDEVPSSVTVLPSKTLEESMLITTNIIDILTHHVPGLAPSTGTSSNWGQTLRGRPMLIMIDGVPQSTPLRNGAVDMRALDPAVIERVEVIKGATAVYGNGAAGGLVNYITKTPRQAKPLSSRTSLGMGGSLVSLDNSIGARVSQMFYGQNGKFDYVVSGIYEQTGEWIDAEGDVLPPTYGLGETDSYNGFVKLGYDLNASHHLQLSYNYYSSEQKTHYVPDFGNYEEKRKTKAVLGDIEGVPQGVGGNHNLNFRYTGKDVFLKTSYDVNFYYQSVDNVFFWSPVFVGGGQSVISSRKKGLRFVFNTPLLSSHHLSSEISYGLDLLNDVTSQPLVDGRVWVPEMDMASYAPFAQLQMNLFQSLVFKGGFRMEKVNIGVEDYKTLETVNTVTDATNPSFDVKGGELSYNAYLFNVGLRYNKINLFTPYISFSQGFSVADVGAMLRAAQVNDIADINTEAIVIDNYEAGFVSKYKNFRFEGVGYISTSELGTSGRFVDGVFEVVRSPEKVYGFEAIADVKVTEQITAGANYSWVEGKMDVNDNGSFSDTEDQYLGGERISPPKLAAYVRYTLLDNKLALKLLYTGIGNRSRFEKNEQGSYDIYKAPVKAYQLVDFSASYQFSESTTLNLGVENLFNEDYFPARSQWFTLPTLYTKGKGASFNLSVNISF